MTSCDKTFAIIADIEGGAELVTDQGGLTKYGISQRAFPEVDIASLTYDGAFALFKTHYWDVVKADSLPADLAPYVVDAAFNMGPGTAIQLLQKALSVAVDGILGPQTFRAISRANVRQLIASFNAARVQRYQGLRDYDKVGRGWLRRVFLLCQDIGHAG